MDRTVITIERHGFGWFWYVHDKNDLHRSAIRKRNFGYADTFQGARWASRRHRRRMRKSKELKHDQSIL